MIRWKDSEPGRLHPQEQALLALLDRMTVLEQAFTAEAEAHALTRKRLDHVQRQLAQVERQGALLRADHRALFDILGGE